jgi:excisionase family DNA binding protein
MTRGADMPREIEGYREALAELNESYAHQRWLSITQVAKYLGVSTRTVRRMIEDGRIEAYNLGTQEYKIYRIDKHDLAKVVVGGRKR